jgi:hypothetical protein
MFWLSLRALNLTAAPSLGNEEGRNGAKLSLLHCSMSPAPNRPRGAVGSPPGPGHDTFVEPAHVGA